jgi:hypothetical protein
MLKGLHIFFSSDGVGVDTQPIPFVKVLMVKVLIKPSKNHLGGSFPFGYRAEM